MFSEKDYINKMDYDLHNIYLDTRERKRMNRFEDYLHSLKHTVVDDINRVTTSNDEYFFYKEIKRGKLLNGDFYYNGCLFEFKSYPDLLDSIGDTHRSNKQVDDLLKDSIVNQYIIISPCLNEFNFKDNFYDQERFETIKNFFNQFVPFHIHFIPTTTEKMAFRDMINIWRCHQSPYNLFVLNKKYPLNPFLNNLTLIPAINHNDAIAIFKTYPYTMAEDVTKLTEEMLLNVKFGRKKRFDNTKIKSIIEQRDILFPRNVQMDKINDIVSKIDEIEREA